MKKFQKTITITYDEIEDIAYIYLASIKAGEITDTIPVDDLPNQDADVVLDFAKETFKGIELIGASRVLPQRLLQDDS
ncbi:MAG: DUF2283 domain-containing protein [Candidatus Doudnabacteria bacterium]|nr:DUF2283 domain-containing protein [Candidatus Doudnabacteria bacterium]